MKKPAVVARLIQTYGKRNTYLPEAGLLLFALASQLEDRRKKWYVSKKDKESSC